MSWREANGSRAGDAVWWRLKRHARRNSVCCRATYYVVGLQKLENASRSAVRRETRGLEIDGYGLDCDAARRVGASAAAHYRRSGQPGSQERESLNPQSCRNSASRKRGNRWVDGSAGDLMSGATPKLPCPFHCPPCRHPTRDLNGSHQCMEHYPKVMIPPYGKCPLPEVAGSLNEQ